MSAIDFSTNPEEILDSALTAFEEDYDNVDIYRSEEELCEYPCLKCEVEFVSLELINSATLRALRTGRFSVLILAQGTDHELEYSRPILDAVTESFECDLDELRGLVALLKESLSVNTSGFDKRRVVHQCECL